MNPLLTVILLSSFQVVFLTPIISQSLPDQTFYIGDNFRYEVPFSSFSNGDHGKSPYEMKVQKNDIPGFLESRMYDPRIVGSLFGGPDQKAMDFCLDEGVLYVCVRNRGLVAIDISIPTQSEIISEFSKSLNYSSVTVFNDTAYVGYLQDDVLMMDIVDYEDIENPKLIGNLTIPYSGNYFFFNDIISDSSQEEFIFMGISNEDYSIDFGSVIKVNVSNKADPTIVKRVDLGPVKDMKIFGDLLFSLVICKPDQCGGIYIHNISNNLTQLNFINRTIISNAEGFDYDQDRQILYIADKYIGLKCINLTTNIRNRELINITDLGFTGNVYGIHLVGNGDYAIVAGYITPTFGFIVLDVQDLFQIEQVGEWLHLYKTIVYPKYLSSSPNGDYLYFTAFQDGIFIMNISDKSSPIVTQHFAVQSEVKIIKYDPDDNIAVMCSAEPAFFKVLDLSNPLKPKELGTVWNLNSNPDELAMYECKDLYRYGNTVYLAAYQHFIIIDISNRRQPIISNTHRLDYCMYIVSIKNETVFCGPMAATHYGLYNVSDPQYSTFHSWFGVSGSLARNLYFDETTDDKVLYSLYDSTYEFTTYNVSDPYVADRNPIIGTNNDLDTNRKFLTCDNLGDYCYVIINFVGINVVVVTDPETMTRVTGKYQPTPDEIYSIVAYDDLIVSAQDKGLYFLDTSDRLNTCNFVVTHSIPTKDPVNYVHGKGNTYLFGSTDGLRVVQFGNVFINGTASTTSDCGNYQVGITAVDYSGNISHSILLKVRGRAFADDNCEIQICYNISSNSTDVCSGHGVCLPPSDLTEISGTCFCSDGFVGKICDVWSCNGVMSNETSEKTCSGHGSCDLNSSSSILNSFCNCSENYFGIDCEKWKCYDIHFNNFTEVCSSHGECSTPDNCVCNNNYFGKFCNITSCWGIFNNDTELSSSICHGNGYCSKHDYCICFPEIEYPKIKHCSCATDYYGKYCNHTKCNEVMFNDTENVCSGHGTCNIDTKNCTCDSSNYTGSFCEIWDCFGKTSTGTNVCTNHGECNDVNKCICSSTTYSGNECQFWSCWGVNVKDTEKVCGGHGSCLDQDSCFCLAGYESEEPGTNCSKWRCGKYSKDDVDVCNKRGSCISSHYCKCKDDYEGKLCETFSCGYEQSDENTCNGRGKCKNPNECDCKTGYSGSLCQTNLILPSVLAPLSLLSLGIVGIIISCLLCSCFFVLILVASFIMLFFGLGLVQTARVNRYGKLRNFKILLKEQELEEDTTIAHLRMNDSLFEIKFSELKINELLGEGGSSSIVYKASWNNQVVAFKSFKTRLICSSQLKFDEFEREVEVLASVSHPNIVRFYGATIQQPRIGIIMEFCPKGDLSMFLQTFKRERIEEKNGSLDLELEEELRNNNNLDMSYSYPLWKKIQRLQEVVHAMDYLHTRNIIHRDLKLENVLLDEMENCKLMDFGLSTIVDRMSKQKTTRIGTNNYMAPEVLSESAYTEKCDVYSFSIFIYILLTEQFEPFGIGKEAIHIEIKVSSDPDFRPSLAIFDSIIPQEIDWIRKLMVLSWSHLPSERPSFSKLNDVFSKKMGKLMELENVVVYKKLLDDKDDEKKKKKSEIIFEEDDHLMEEEKIEIMEKELKDVKSTYLEMKKRLLERHTK